MVMLGGNITPRLARTEMGGAATGLPTDDLTVKHVCGYASQNKFSFYGPWTLSVDANKTLVLDSQSDNYRLGDFRLYNHGANTPNVGATVRTHYYGPGGTTANWVLQWFPTEMNILEATNKAYNAAYVCFRYYYTSAARAADASGHFNQNVEAIDFNQLTVGAGNLMLNHIRTPIYRAANTQLPEVTFQTSDLITDPETVYVDCYISDGTGNRLLNVGNSKAGGYFTITAIENKSPKINASGNCTFRTGYTGTFTHISTSTVDCSTAEVPVSVGGYGFDFRMTAIGYDASPDIYYNIYPTSCTVQMIHYSSLGVPKETYNFGSGISFHNNQSTQFTSFAYGNKSVAWQYNDYAIVSITAVATWGTAVACTPQPF